MKDRRQEQNQLARKVIESDLFGADALTAPEEVPVPAKYELIRPLGRGGAGVVWLARDSELGRYAALKYLSEEKPSVLERFRREARYAARLNSPSIVKVYEIGEVEGRHFIAMEFVDGGNLADARLEQVEIVQIIRETAIALQHAHENGIVHRDIKPENILLDSQRRAFLSDFGIARDLDQESGLTLSREGEIVGTPASMSPEQARGDLHAVDARSDVYSLGATFFFKLTGRWPFEGSNVIDVLHAVIHDEPPFLRSQVQSIPRSLEAIVLRCLRKARGDRYQSMAELVRDLDHHRQGRPVASESKAWFRVLVQKVTGVALPKESGPAEVDPYLTLGVEVARELAVWDADRYRVSKNFHKSFERLDGITDRLSVFLEQRPGAAWARYYRGAALFRRGKLAEALDDMERAVNRVGNPGTAHFDLGRLYLAIHLKEQQEARKHLTQRGVEQHLEVARSRLEQAVLAFEEARRLEAHLPHWQEHYADAVARFAENDFEACVSACDSILADDPDAEEVWKLRGDALRFSGGDPIESYRRACQIRRSFHEACLAEAEVHLERGRLAEAQESLQLGLDIHPELVDALVLGARIALTRARDQSTHPAARAGKPSEAIVDGVELARRALKSAPAHYEAHLTCAELLVEQGRVEAGGETLDGALELLERARSLPGCQNRVNLVTARALLERARRSAAEGRDARSDLERILDFGAEVERSDMDSTQWSSVVEAAREMNAR